MLLGFGHEAWQELHVVQDLFGRIREGNFGSILQNILNQLANLHRNVKAGNGRIGRNGRNDMDLSNSAI